MCSAHVTEFFFFQLKIHLLSCVLEMEGYCSSSKKKQKTKLGFCASVSIQSAGEFIVRFI